MTTPGATSNDADRNDGMFWVRAERRLAAEERERRVRREEWRRRTGVGESA